MTEQDPGQDHEQDHEQAPAPTRVHAFRDDALGDHDAVELAALLRAGKVTATELAEAATARLRDVDPHLGALAHDATDRGRAEAAALGSRLPDGAPALTGVPTFLKDNVDVAGMPTQHGTDAFTSGPKKADGDLAAAYLATGTVLFGKTRLSEFGFSAAAEHPRQGPVRNPWDTRVTAGASSAGSAALVAAGVVPLAHANDGGGSIRIPAAVNGLVGLKPTRDRVPQDAQFRQMPVRIVADAVVTRTVRDTAVWLREVERVHRNLALPPIGDVSRPGRARRRVAVVTRSVGREATPEVREATLRTAGLLEQLGHQVEEVDPPVPPGFADDFLLYWSFLAGFLVRTGRLAHGRTWDRSRLDELTVGLERHARRNLHRLPLATRRLAASKHVSAAFFQRYDVVLTPTLAAPTPDVGHLHPSHGYDAVVERLLDWVAFTPLQNATGDPAVSLPLAHDAAGRPLGMMLGAAAGREATLLEMAFELEEAAPFARLQDPPGSPA